MLAAAKKRPLNVLLTPHLGYGSAAALAQAAGKTAGQVRHVTSRHVTPCHIVAGMTVFCVLCDSDPVDTCTHTYRPRSWRRRAWMRA